VLYTADATLSDSEVQSSVDTPAAAAAALEPERRQSRSLSIIARALGKGLDARRPSTVAAVFAAATSSLAPTRRSRRPSAVRASSERDQDDVEASSRPRKVAVNSVTWKDVENPVNYEQRPNRNPNSMTDTRQSVEQLRGEQLNEYVR